MWWEDKSTKRRQCGGFMAERSTLLHGCTRGDIVYIRRFAGLQEHQRILIKTYIQLPQTAPGFTADSHTCSHSALTHLQSLCNQLTCTGSTSSSAESYLAQLRWPESPNIGTWIPGVFSSSLVDVRNSGQNDKMCSQVAWIVRTRLTVKLNSSYFMSVLI